MSAQSPDDDRAPARSHQCPRCGRAMTFVGAVPHERYTNLQTETFECEACGEKTTAVVREN